MKPESCMFTFPSPFLVCVFGLHRCTILVPPATRREKKLRRLKNDKSRKHTHTHTHSHIHQPEA